MMLTFLAKMQNVFCVVLDDGIKTDLKKVHFEIEQNIYKNVDQILNTEFFAYFADYTKYKYLNHPCFETLPGKFESSPIFRYSDFSNSYFERYNSLKIAGNDSFDQVMKIHGLFSQYKNIKELQIIPLYETVQNFLNYNAMMFDLRSHKWLIFDFPSYTWLNWFVHTKFYCHFRKLNDLVRNEVIDHSNQEISFSVQPISNFINAFKIFFDCLNSEEIYKNIGLVSA
jgi:hypothetical protein